MTKLSLSEEYLCFYKPFVITKDIELEELRETIDRLETEKGDLLEEMKETKDQLNALEAASEQVSRQSIRPL